MGTPPEPTTARAVGITCAKAHFSALIAAVEAGESITITKRGRPVAILSPVREYRSASEAVAAWRKYRATHPSDPSKRDPEFDITDRRTLHIGHRY